VPAEPPTPSDAELARQTQAGSPAALEELVHRYEHRVYAFVSQFCRNATDAREITQDTFVQAAQRIAQFDPRREFAPWLFTIARHKWIDRQRAAPPPAGAPPPEIAEELHPGELLAQAEDRQQLWRLARARLTENQFQALWLHYAEDLAVPHVARVLGKTRVHVKVLLFRARQTLGRHLNPARTPAQALPASKPPLTPLNRTPAGPFAGGKIAPVKIP
jgi:RNA polymerase sigma-70 factor (ECF subfamily)